MKEIGVVSWKLPSREMSCQHFRDHFPPEKITTFTDFSYLWTDFMTVSLSSYSHSTDVVNWSLLVNKGQTDRQSVHGETKYTS